MIIAKLWFDTSAIASQMNGNFWIVVMMMRLLFSMASFKSFDESACAIIFSLLPNALMLSVICLSSKRRSVTTMTESYNGASRAFALTASIESGQTLISLKANHVREFDLPEPAECSIRYVLPTPFSATSAVSLVTTSSWWKRGKINFLAFFIM